MTALGGGVINHARWGEACPTNLMKESMTKTTISSRPHKRTSRLPLGYVWREGDDGKLSVAPDPERAPMIRKVFIKVAKGEWTAQWASLWLTYEAGFTTRGGRCLSAPSVLDLLANPAYSDERLPPLVPEGTFKKARLIARNVLAWKQ